VTYTYDGNDLRVAKSNGTLYWRSITGDVLAESDLQGNITNEYVFFAGRRIARISSGTVNYFYADAVGTVHTITDASGNACYDASFTPYGQEVLNPNISQTCSSNYKFAGYEYDSETGLYYAKARYYNPRLGRFMSPDPLRGDLTDPQTLNGYAYVSNSPTNWIDPSGMIRTPWGFAEGNVDYGGSWNEFSMLSIFINPVYVDGGVAYSAGTGLDLLDALPSGIPLNLPHGLIGAPFNPPPPPPSKNCLTALSDAGRSAAGYYGAEQNWGTLANAGSANGVDPALLGAIGVYESNFQNTMQQGGCCGVGYFQIDIVQNGDVSLTEAENLPTAANYAAGILASGMNWYLSQAVIDPLAGAAGGLRAYNHGYGTGYIDAQLNLMEYGSSLGDLSIFDQGTANGDYATNVLGIAVNCFNY